MKKENRIRVNDQIRISPVVVIKDNENLGEMSVKNALKLADDWGLDLVEIVPDQKPPICKIIDYGKFKYEQKMKEKSRKHNSKTIETKEIRLRPVTDEHDLMIKINQASKFLSDGNNVLFRIKFKRRETNHKELGFGIINKVIDSLSEISSIKSDPVFSGYNIVCILQSKKINKNS